jgi:NifB/MoaA-like Fe-S oxidoreductase
MFGACDEEKEEKGEERMEKSDDIPSDSPVRNVSMRLCEDCFLLVAEKIAS